jgi:hypothetical protein
MTWRRRLRQIAGGVVLLQAAILGILAFSVWRESMELLQVPSSMGLQFAFAAQRATVDYLRLVLPLLLWLVLNVRGDALRPWLASRGGRREETQELISNDSLCRPIR